MKKEDDTFLDKAASFLKKAAAELEEFQVQASLGKAELADSYEDAKKKFNQVVHEAKFKMKDSSHEAYQDLRASLDELVVQLNLGKAETKDAFTEQKKKILLQLHEVEVKIKSDETLNKVKRNMLTDIELFKLKLELLEAQLNDGTDRFKATYEESKKEFLDFVEQMKSKYQDKEEETEKHWDHFQGEMTEAFNHFKQAFTK